MRLKKSREEIILFDCLCLIYKHSDTYQIKLPHDFLTVNNRNIKDQRRIQVQYHQDTAYLTFIQEIDPMIEQRVMIQEQIITIGNHEADTICIPYALWNGFSFQMDFQKDRIQILQNHSLYLNHEQIKEDTCFHIYDRLECMNLTILFAKDFILVSSLLNTAINLEPYHIDTEITYLPSYPAIHQSYEDIPSLNSTITIALEEPDHVSDTEQQPLIFTLGPGLMMSCASLTAGFMNAYQNYLAGREISTMIPMILLPCTMLISTLLWNPLSRLSNHRKIKKKKRIRNEKYQRQFIEKKEEVRRFQMEYHLLSEKYYPEAQTLYTKVVTQESIPLHNLKEGCLIRLGSRKNAESVIIEKKWKNTDTVIDQITKEGISSFTMQEEHAFLFDLLSAQKIMILKGRYQKALVAYILMQISAYYRMPVILCTEELKDIDIWMEWIPGLQNENGIRNVAINEIQLQQILTEHKEGPVLIIQYGKNAPKVKRDNSSTLIIQKENEDDFSDVRIYTDESSALILTAEHEQIDFRISAFEEDLYPFYLSIPRDKELILQEGHSFLEHYDVLRAEQIDLKERRKQNDINSHLKALLGKGDDQKIYLDLNEKADGPHGLIAGTTGSGKSELILSLLLSIAVEYASRDVQFALIDFKGGGIAQILKGLPHIAGYLSNLDMDDMLRALVSFQNECIRRERLIALMNEKAGTPIMNLNDYRIAWKKEMGLPYLSDLIIAVDEFAELKKERPEFLKDLISISRIGRSLGIHLILSTQRPTGVVNDEILSNCSFKICLKVAEKQDSLEMINTADAINLKGPGSFCLLVNQTLQKGIASYANAVQRKDVHQIAVIDERGEVLIDTKENTGKAELLSIIELIQSAEDSNSVKKLWLDALEELHQTEIPYVIGKMDDYYHHRQPYIKIIPNKNHLFVSVDHDEKRRLLRTVLYTLISHRSIEEELYTIDDGGMIPREYEPACAVYTDTFTSDYHEKLVSLYTHIQNSKHAITVILSDLSRYYEAHEEDRMILHHLLEHADEYHCTLILFSPTASVLPYQDLALISERYTLKNENLQDIQMTLESSEKILQKKEHFGLCKEEHVLECRWIETSKEELWQAVLKKQKEYGKQKAFILPCMPQLISLSMYPKEKIPLGMKQDLSWLEAETNEKTVIVATYREELHSFQKIMHRYSSLLYMTLDEYRSSSYSLPILYIGKGYSEQYVFHTKVHALKENEGIYISEANSEVIRLVERE